MKHRFLSLLTAAILTGGVLTAQADEVTLAAWTFQTGYAATPGEGTAVFYTPDASAEVADVTGWFNTITPYVLPETYAGEAQNAYTLSAYSEGRYFQFCNGYETRVFRIENTADPTVTDYSDASQHKVYYELSFPTKGYKDINITYAIAPGNNTQTPVEMTVSTDGGQTWIDAGAANTSAVWFQYEDRNVALSANNKDNVRVRLHITSGTTNWNMRNISIQASPMDALPGVSNADINFTWPMGSTTPELAAQASIPDLFSVAELAIGTGLTISKTATPAGGSTQTLFKPSNNNSNDLNKDDALVFTLIPRKGITFKPTAVAFQASKHGTGGGNLAVEVSRGEQTVIVNDALNPERSGTGANFSQFNEAVTGFDAAGGALTVTIYINKLANNKEMGLADIVIYGVADGQVQPVPVYTFAMSSAVEGAGSLSVAPAGNEFDEGTLLTVSATENFGYHFTNWTDEAGTVLSEANPYKFEIMADTKLVANYTSKNVYALNLTIDGGANVNQVEYTPAGHIVDGVHHYEEGTDVKLTALNNRILTFTNWSDNSTNPELSLTMDSDKDVTATFSAADYIVGWDFYFDQPNSERAADFRAESDNAGLLSLHNDAGQTSTWLTRGINNGAENGKWGARIWRLRSDGFYFEASFSTLGYSNILVSAALGISYNSYAVNNMEWSLDGVNYQTAGTYNLQSGWTTNEFSLPAEANNQPKVYVRWNPDRNSELVGAATDYDGLCIAELFVLADRDAANDDQAPELVSTIPANNSEGASATGSIILTFNEKVVVGTGDATLNGEKIAPRASGKSVVYSYAGLDYATAYTFTLPAGAITDRSGNPFAGTTLTFTTMERVQPEARLFDAIVATDGSGDYATIQDAIDAAPAGRIKPWLIFVKNGTYEGHVDIPANKPMLHFIGQDRDKAVISHDRLCGGDNAYNVSAGATVVVNANDCFFENITLENSHGHKQQAGPQALALNTAGDRTVFNNVAMLSYQDTWITPSTSNYRAYVRNSFIEGAVDFIYNSGNIYIDNTTLYINRKSGGFIVAPSHATDVEWGYVFNNCTITAPGNPTETDVWLGRPWHNFPKTVFLNTRAEVTIPAAGWYETMGGLPVLWADWNTTDINGNPVDLSQRRSKYYYTDANGEKVWGEAKNFLTDEEAAEYTVANVLSGSDQWQPVIKTEECDAPVVKGEQGLVSWEAVPYAICYVVTKGDDILGITTETSQAITTDWKGVAVQAVNEFGGLSAKGAASEGSSIVDVEAAGEPTVIGIYDLQGRALKAPVKGVNIIRLMNADGTVTARKVIM